MNVSLVYIVKKPRFENFQIGVSLFKTAHKEE
nr:MAG TPA: hypothetical protein [Caudoviricetes sp.]